MAERTLNKTLSGQLSELWWLWILQALAGLLFGTIAVFWPGLTLVTLVYLLGAFVLLIGVIEIITALSSLKVRDTWWMTLVIGLITLGVGIYLARHPLVSFKTFILVVGVSFIVWGVIDVLRAFVDVVASSHRVLNFVAGLAGVAAGIVTLLQPVAGGLAFVWVLGLFAFIYGIAGLVMAIDHHHDYAALKSALDV